MGRTENVEDMVIGMAVMFEFHEFTDDEWHWATLEACGECVINRSMCPFSHARKCPKVNAWVVKIWKRGGGGKCGNRDVVDREDSGARGR